VHERDRKVGGVLEPQGPVERRVAAPDDDASLPPEDVLAPDEIVEAPALPVVNSFDLELARLESAVSGRHDQRTGEETLARLRRERENVFSIL
jgi:hypothetical protein